MLLPLLHVVRISTILTGLGPTAAFQNITWHRKGVLKSHIGPKLMARQLTIELAAKTAHSVTTTHKLNNQEIDPPEFSDDVLTDDVFTQKKYLVLSSEEEQDATFLSTSVYKKVLYPESTETFMTWFIGPFAGFVRPHWNM